MKDIIKVVDILLPKKDIDYSKWAVVACDQYTSEPDYWQKLESFVGNEKSTLNIVFPEVYLGVNDEKRIANINATMKEYLKNDTFDVVSNSFILVDRVTSDGNHRLGLVMAVDLEEYDFSPESKASIKATEGTVIERIPPRVKIRQNAVLELPHIMLLMDDRKCDIIESLYKNRQNLNKLYDFDMNMNGGHISGYQVTNTKDVINKIYHLLDENEQIEKYGVKTNILFSVGDGNHSLATAKCFWDSIKQNLKESEKANHPARYALVELVNLHDKGINFEPIHRVVFNVNDAIISDIKAKFASGETKLEMSYKGESFYVYVPSNAPLAIDNIQTYIDGLVKQNLVSVDYVHGRQNTLNVAGQNNLAIFMPTIKKEELFSYIIEKGVLPRKSFSMGEANDKRYYLEAKRIAL